MKILFIAHETNLGGATKSLLGLIDELIIRKHEVIVLCPNYEGNLNKELEQRNVEYIKAAFYPWTYSEKYCKTIKCKIKKIITKKTAVYLKKILLEKNIDVIHTNSSTVDIGLLLAKLLNKPHVFQFREFGYEDQGIVFRDGLEDSMKKISQNSNCVVFISKCLQKKYYSYISCEQKMIYNGISLDYCVDKKNEIKDKVKFVICGSVVRNKGHEEVIEAARELVARNIYGFNIDIVGNGDDTFIDELKKKIEIYRLKDIINYFGYSTEMKRIRAHADVELVCSNMEAFGRVTIEAMLGHNPVIASDTGANPELVEEGITGLLYKKGDYTNLADKMEELICCRRKIYEMGERAYEYARSNFNSTINADKFEKLYNSLIIEEK